MKIYLAYKLSERDPAEVKLKLQEMDSIIKKLGHKTFIFMRDVQDWNPGGMEPKEIMKRAMKEMKKCDIILSIIEVQEKGEGMLLESGFMKALGKKLIVASSPEGRGILLKGMADEVFEFKDMKEFEGKLKRIIS
jgi:nucleoside 2-deoxyribosyltransferase